MKLQTLINSGRVVSDELLLEDDPTAYDSYRVPDDTILRLTTDSDTYTVTYLQVLIENNKPILCIQLEGCPEDPVTFKFTDELPIKVFRLLVE